MIKKAFCLTLEVITMLITVIIFVVLTPIYYLYACLFVAWGMAKVAVDDFIEWTEESHE